MPPRYVAAIFSLTLRADAAQVTKLLLMPLRYFPISFSSRALRYFHIMLLPCFQLIFTLLMPCCC